MRNGCSETCRRQWARIVLAAGLIVLTVSPAAAQGSAASIIGQVTDQSGAVLPGVTVTATSPALAGAATDSRHQ